MKTSEQIALLIAMMLVQPMKWLWRLRIKKVRWAGKVVISNRYLKGKLVE